MHVAWVNGGADGSETGTAIERPFPELAGGTLETTRTAFAGKNETV
jgi:hypothetical protein